MKTERQATTHRATSETDITVTLDLDGSGKANIDTGIGFFDHMLTALSKHSLIDLSVKVQGDLHIDGHHTVEDTGIAIGQTLRQALGDKRGVRRFGHALVPLDEALCEAVVDLSGRPFLAFDATFDRDRIGEMDTELVEEFFRAFAMSGLLTLHLTQKAGKNCHHIAEAGFKALARALRMAVEADPRAQDAIPSTKGKL
ncbi:MULTISPECIES: imidazoleglycerol-phosphate dehydratase HisB [Acetobacter]|uniref:Imidazoleglycerol-phosphate dehydratase n=1 Tax=Acetobacter thailandicus TaxID=1502842 RepID=A0ABT3QE50_9PROT|nr:MULTISPECIES: imidazoleglycerol-phosphate dehydratase HisB [Acetobacter]MBS0980228.1 imidazoleglycerol-phosphate dehydratase HisB [Acetobacter thailandicus]MBS1004100.1 imidazoleglycerol-phosphate dehydratase HisB [Acetobacter thailandicus]MCX2563562.1 imidazoleglycerol-phosphate dehydratase HisB [Acetobacter thailandicus]NHN94315.1 imidazoleglycerol-phosphate dehydratase HisB [Acetobacter thailandicus]OUI89213.1 imidazoleglycerol-phosphate dehydratase [Acetobacter sp. DmW_043]